MRVKLSRAVAEPDAAYTRLPGENSAVSGADMPSRVRVALTCPAPAHRAHHDGHGPADRIAPSTNTATLAVSPARSPVHATHLGVRYDERLSPASTTTSSSASRSKGLDTKAMVC